MESLLESLNNRVRDEKHHLEMEKIMYKNTIESLTYELQNALGNYKYWKHIAQRNYMFLYNLEIYFCRRKDPHQLLSDINKELKHRGCLFNLKIFQTALHSIFLESHYTFDEKMVEEYESYISLKDKEREERRKITKKKRQDDLRREYVLSIDKQIDNAFEKFKNPEKWMTETCEDNICIKCEVPTEVSRTSIELTDDIQRRVTTRFNDEFADDKFLLSFGTFEDNVSIIVRLLQFD